MAVTPLQKYDFTLDDLENVEGFNQDGIKDKIYGFKLEEDGIYCRHEIMDNGGIINQPINFVYEDNKWITIPAKYNWDVDIKVTPVTTSRKGDVLTIINSGTLVLKYVSLPGDNIVRDRAIIYKQAPELRYCISSFGKRPAIYQVHIDSPSDYDTINNPPVGSTIIIEGIILSSESDDKEILPGLIIANDSNYGVEPFTFKIILFKEDILKYDVRVDTPDIRVILVENNPVELSTIYLYNSYAITRIRLTTQPVTDPEIKYL